jgi:signal transduction histidine kinase
MSGMAPPAVRLDRVAWSALWAAAFGFGLVSLLVARSHPDGSFAGTSRVAAVAELAAGWALIAVGLRLALRRSANRSGYLLAAAGISWFFVEWNNPGIGSPAAFTFGLMAWALAPPVVAHAVLVYPSGRPLPAPGRAALLAAYVGAGLVLGLLPALVFDPKQQGCSQCPANLLSVASNQDAVRVLTQWGVWLGLVWPVALAAVAAWRFTRSSTAVRWMAAPVVLGGVVYLLLVWADFVHGLPRGELGNDDFERALWLGQAIALGTIALGVTWPWLRARRTRSVLASIVVDLGHSPPPGGLREALASTLGDPALQVAYPLADPGRYIDAHGVAVDPAGRDGRTVTPLARGGTAVALLIHRPGLLDNPELVQEVAVAARIALENERLQAIVRGQMEDLRASRARVVAAGDAERRRLEHDLHDGAQQRLVSLSLALRLARTQLGAEEDPDLICGMDQAGQEIGAAIEELRELAHGIYPAVLTDEGLAAAVEALGERAAIPVRVAAVPEGRFPLPVEAAAYFLVAEACGKIAVCVEASSVAVQVTHEGERLLVDITEAGAGKPGPEVEARLTGLSDRVGALDGRLRIEQLPGWGLAIHGEIPCGS